MHVAAVTGSSPIASSLLQSGNVNVNSRTSRGDTPLHLATRNNHLDIVGALLHGGAQVDVKGTVSIASLVVIVDDDACYFISFM